MDKRRFIKQQIKSDLLFIIVFAAFALLWGLLGATHVTFYSSGAIFLYQNTNLSYSAFFPFLFASIFPLTVFTYRYDKPSTDFFFQMPIDKRYIKRVRLLIGLIALFLFFTVNFFLDMAIVAVRYLNSPELPDEYIHRLDYNFLGYLVAYPLLLISFFVAFGVSSFFASLSNNKKDMVLMTGFGLLTLLLAFFSFASLILSFAGELPTGYTDAINVLNFSLSPLTTLFDAISWSENLILGYSSYYVDGLKAIQIVLYVLAVAIGIFGFFFAFFSKERSGEDASTNGGYNAFTILLPHLCFFFLGLAASSRWAYEVAYSSYFIGASIITLAYLVAYYFLLCLYYKRLKLNKRDLYAYIGVSLTFAIMAISILLASPKGV